MNINIKKIRNFSIIAHVDHGKSTIADRIIEKTETINSRNLKQQMLDTLDLERERGITIKLNTIRIDYAGYILNLIDTPGHVDFSYEVSRALAACEGCLLIVDASQGIQAQTLSNLKIAQKNNLTIIPVLNKIDLPIAEPQKYSKEIAKLLNIKEEEIILASGKSGLGIEQILDKIITKIPAPKKFLNTQLQALIFDSFYDPYKGAIPYIKIIQGTLKKVI